MSKKHIGIVFGGRSVEHDISLRSAANVATHLDKDLFEVTLIGIDKSGTWHLSKDCSSPTGDKVAVLLDAQNPRLINATSNAILPKFDAVFPVLHGTDGEDGSVQGLLKALNVPCLGSGVLGSAASMNKIVSKKLLLDAGIPVAKYVAVNRFERSYISYDKIVDKLGKSGIVKPANLGSSVGVNLFHNKEQFETAIAEGFRYDSEVLIEELIKGRELECAIMGNERPKASLPGEIVIQGNYEFYDFDAKYVDPNAVRLDIPAEVPGKLIKEIQDLSIRSYRALYCNDFARVDLFLKEDGSVLINEINTIPGFTNSSMFPMLWKQEGVSYTALLTELVQLCLHREQLRHEVETDFKNAL